MQAVDEVRLIKRAKAGDGEAVAALIRAHQDSLYAFMLRMSGRPEVAEDIVQEAFVRVLKNLDRFDTRYRFSTWLFTIAKRLYVNAMQKHKPAFDSDLVDHSISQPSASEVQRTSPSATTARGEMMDNLRELLNVALSELNVQQREIVLLFHQQNWPIAEISAHLQMPEGTVKSHLHRARCRMKRVITSSDRLHAQAREVWATETGGEIDDDSGEVWS